jgi:GNAT superfamily N-acetyltransferase
MHWPDDPPVAAVRFARATHALEDCLSFYRDLLGLHVLAEFRDHDGYDGVVLGLPDRSVQLELVRHDGAAGSARSEEDALVLYLEDHGASLRARLGDVEVGVPSNPYWARLGAYDLTDPDGGHVLVVPASDHDEPRPEFSVEPFTGDRADLRWSFREAEDSESVLDGSIDEGLVWVARGPGGEIAGHVQTVTHDEGATWEVLSTAVAERVRGLGVGRLLLEHACSEARAAGARRLEVATAAADTGNLRFYQRCGLRMREVVRDRFVPATGYPDPIEIEGIPLRDQVWFDLDL